MVTLLLRPHIPDQFTSFTLYFNLIMRPPLYSDQFSSHPTVVLLSRFYCICTSTLMNFLKFARNRYMYVTRWNIMYTQCLPPVQSFFVTSDNRRSITSGWLIDQSQISVHFHDNPIKMWNAKYRNQTYSIRCSPIDHRYRDVSLFSILIYAIYMAVGLTDVFSQCLSKYCVMTEEEKQNKQTNKVVGWLVCLSVGQCQNDLGVHSPCQTFRWLVIKHWRTYYNHFPL